jgi:putative transposase
MANKAHQIKLYPTKRQEAYFKKACGVARFSYNWALDRWKQKYEQGERTSAYDLIKELTLIKKQEYPWMLEVTKTAPQYAIHNLERAYNNFFKKNARYPRFKKKGIKDSFVAVENKNTFKHEHRKIWIPRLGWVRCRENLRFKGKVNNVVVKRVADMWFAVVNIETFDEAPMVSENQVTVGVDLGVKHMMILNDGKTFDNPKSLKKNLRKLKREQRRLSRKQKGSNNRKKQQVKVARLHYKISNMRKHAIHNATKYLVSNFDRIVIEDLNVRGMLKNHNLAQSISDVSFGEIRRQLEYKSKWYGCDLIVVDRFFASSKLCSSCGYKLEKLNLNTREWVCPQCGEIHYRDENAAKNLANYSPTSEAEGSNVCGEGKVHGYGQVAFYEAETNC